MPIEKYGYRFPDGTLPVTIELRAYRDARTTEQGGLGQFQHLKNVVDLIWNAGDTVRSFTWSNWAEDMLYEVCEEKYLSVAGCASSGKSDAFAIWGIVEYLSGPTDTMVLITSTTMREARRRIWKSVVELWDAVPKGQLPGKLVNSLGFIKGLTPNGKSLFEGTGIALVPAEKKKEKDAIGKLVGVKQKRLRLIADELPELPESIVHAAFTNMSTTEDFRMVGLGNPASRFDAFGLFSKPKDGWDSVSEADQEWETSRGKCIRLDVLKCANYVERKMVYPWMPSYENVEQARRDYGEDSQLFYRMYRGFWCPDGASTGIYSEAELTQGLVTQPAKFEDPQSAVLLAAIDPSFSSGGDRCTVMFGRLGMEDGANVLEFLGCEHLHEDITNRAVPRSHQIARQFRDLCQKRGVAPRNAALDITGAGAPLADVISMEWSPEVLGVNFSGRPSSRKVSAHDKAKSIDRYTNRASELWFAGKELLRTYQLRAIGDEQASEMVSREYSVTAGGKLTVEPKENYKRRTGKSPDIADAGFILIDLARERHGLIGSERFEASTGRQETFQQRIKGFDVYQNSDRKLLRF